MGLQGNISSRNTITGCPLRGFWTRVVDQLFTDDRRGQSWSRTALNVIETAVEIQHPEIAEQIRIEPAESGCNELCNVTPGATSYRFRKKIYSMGIFTNSEMLAGPARKGRSPKSRELLPAKWIRCCTWSAPPLPDFSLSLWWEPATNRSTTFALPRLRGSAIDPLCMYSQLFHRLLCVLDKERTLILSEW